MVKMCRNSNNSRKSVAYGFSVTEHALDSTQE
jgi:hypothetical protein